MKTKKLIVAILAFLTALMIFSLTDTVNAASLGTLTISKDRTVDSVTYKHQLYSDNTSSTKNVWNLVTCTPEGIITDTIPDLYCLRAGLGFTSASPTKTVVEYNQSYNMTERYSDLVTYFSGVTSETKIFDESNTYNFNAVMWILDHMLLEGATEDEVDAYLKTYAGYTDEVLNRKVVVEGIEYDGLKEEVLTRADIEAIQQLAIWYFTNRDESLYANDTLPTLYMLIDGDAIYDTEDTYKTYVDIFNTLESYGTQRQAYANSLYTTLITGAKSAAYALVVTGGISEVYTPSREITVYLAGTDAAAEQPVVRVEESKYVDIALRKFITSVKHEETVTNINTRIPTPDTSKFNKVINEVPQTTAIYNHTKTPVKVEIGDIVTYTLRIYNEGEVDTYIREVTDYLPEYLEYVASGDDTGAWWLLNTTNPRIATSTEYVKVVGAGGNIDPEEAVGKYLGEVLLPAAEYDEPTDSWTLSYVDIQISCEVLETTPYGTNITNIAQVTSMTDAEGTAITEDRDSAPNANFKLPQDTDTTGANKDLPQYTGGNNDGETLFYDESNAVKTGDKVYFPGQEDDDDFEKILIKLPEVDLALRKFISAVDGKELTEANIREPKVDTTALDANKATTATYNHIKTPLTVEKGSLVTYTIRVYNEGDLSAFVKEITDYLPSYLTYLPDNEINKAYGWVYDEKTGKVTTDILSLEKSVGLGAITPEDLLNPYYTANSNLLLAYNPETMTEGPHHLEVKIVCKVNDNAPGNKILTNLAQITEVEDIYGNKVEEDRDSKANGNFTLPEDSKKPEYTGGNNDKETLYYDGKNVVKTGDKVYFPGQEDDDDFEKVLIKPDFDLSLRKFITRVGTTNVNNRYPEVTYVDGKLVYTHTKEPFALATGDVVTYTIRVYNEGEADGYANEITDDVPEGLEFLPENETNITYRWKMLDENEEVTTDVTEAKYIITDYLSEDQEEVTGRNNKIKAFDTEGVTDTNPDYRDIKIAFKVTYVATTKEETARIITNTAQISADSADDIDSVPNRDEVYNYEDKDENEDDIDFDRVKVKYFDLALLKWVEKTQVTLNGKTTETETGHTAETSKNEAPVKIEIKGSDIKKIGIKYVYTIRVMNEGEIEGYAKEVTDYIPEGLKFVEEDNPDWYIIEDGVVGTKALENTLLQPEEYAEVQIVLTWINGTENFGEKINVAEISQDYNESNSPDVDSTPNNKVPEEDDIDDAPVILAVRTGSIQIYVGLIMIVIVTFASGVGLIKKYVLE